LAIIDALCQTTRLRYNGSGEVLDRTDALGLSITYHHDSAGRLVSLVNEAGAATRFEYDLVDRLTDEIGFDGRHQRYCYNAAGELTHLIERGGSAFGPGKVTHFVRDALGRLIAKRHEGGLDDDGQPIDAGELADNQEADAKQSSCDARYAYDALGRLTQAANAASTVEFAYDPLGQLVREVQHLRLPAGLDTAATSADALRKSFAFTHQYDPLGNRTATRLPDGRTLNQLYYGPGHLHQINLDGQVVSDFERDALHREVSRTQGQLSSAFAYDPAGRMVAQRVTRGGVGGPDLSGLAPTADMSANMSGLIERRYAYDAAGQLRQWLDRDRGLTRYGYDAIGRIVQSQIGLHPPATASGASATVAGRAGTPVNSSVARRIPVTTEQFHWDAASNPVPAPSPGLSVVPVPGNRLTVWQNARYRYDAHGKLMERLQGKRGSAAQTLTVLRWDAAHQLTQATVQRGAAESGGITTQTYRYAYDALGRCVAKVDAFGTTAFAWDGDRMALEARGGNETLHLYEPGGFVPLAQVHNGQ
jgi:YD repeat-containing protein